MRRRSRARRSKGILSRRTFIGGGIAGVGGAVLITQSEAFTQGQARREASVNAVDDDEALIGVTTAPSVVAGDDDQELVSIANNAGRELSVTIALSNPDHGTIVEPTAEIGADDTQTFTIDVDSGVSSGEGELPFEIEATGTSSFHASMERQADVEETDEPTLVRSITDETTNNNAAFSIAYQINSPSEFERLELHVENVDTPRGQDLSESFTRENSEGVISYPSRGVDGGAAGDTYEFEFRIYDTDEQLLLSESAERVADGEDDEGDEDSEFGDEDNPRLESATVTDESDTGRNRAQFIVDYEVSNLDEFGEVVVTFDHQEHSWSDETLTSESAPIGTVTYPAQGGTVNELYNTTIEVRRKSGLTVDSQTITTVADGESPPPYSRE
jgi:hypothetical protein